MTIKTMQYELQPETVAAFMKLRRIAPRTQSEQAAMIGRAGGEPLVIMLDGLLRYAKAHHKRFESPLCEDYALGRYFCEALYAVHRLLDGDGAVAHEMGIATDSKDNGVCEDIYWAAVAAGGFEVGVHPEMERGDK